MSDDRIRAAFDDLNRQAADADPEPSLARLGSTRTVRRPRPARPRWVPALAAAALVIVTVGVVAVLGRAPGGDDAAGQGPSDTTVATTLPAVTDPGGGTVPPDVTDGTVVDTTIPDETGESTTTTTDPLEGRQPVFAGEGWRVTGVAADDVLNVRSGPGTQNGIIGTLAPDDTNVRLTGWGTTQADGNEWWGVLLEDGSEGWVNNAFLAAPESWTGDVRAEQCNVEHTPDFGQGGPEPDPADQPNALVGIAHVDGVDCDRYVFVLGDYDGVSYQPVASFNAFGVDVMERPGELAITLPTAIVEAIQVATVEHIEERLVLATTPSVAAFDTSQVSMRLFGSWDSYSVTYRANPARIILDVVDFDLTPSQVVEGGGVFVTPVTVGGANQVEFRGFARPFEAQGSLRIVPITGSVAGVEFGGESVNFTNGADAAFTASWWPAYGEFNGTINGLTPGTYELWVYGSECLGEFTAEALARCGVATRFDIP